MTRKRQRIAFQGEPGANSHIACKDAFAKVKDYSCRLVKRERLEGELSPNHVIDLKVRNDPFSVSMVWQEPKDLQGQEVVYVAGKNDGKMLVKPGGVLGSVGFLALPIDDPRTRKTSKHKITEAGIGNLIEKCEAGWTMVEDAGRGYRRVVASPRPHRTSRTRRRTIRMRA